jgi:Ca2+:H+ antiporter
VEAETKAQESRRKTRRLTFLIPSTEQIKRDAHKEAWKPDSFNPFRKFNTGLSRYSKPRDLEDGGPARRIQSEPGPTSGGGHFGSIDETGAQSSGGLGVGGSDNTHSSEKTAVNGVEKGKSNKPPSIEQQARHRFLDRFHRKGKNPNPLSIENREGFTGGSSDAGVEGDGSKDKKKFTLKSQIMATVFNSWINILILAAPVGIALSYVGGVNEWAVFAVNFVAIIPLAAMLSYATEELALRVGETLGGLLNATFGFVTPFSSPLHPDLCPVPLLSTIGT